MNPIEYEYFEWLVSEIDIPNNKTYNELFDRMHNLEFVWTVPNDDNRIEDGLDLRSEFFSGSHGPFSHTATLLEVLVALSRRVAFTAGGDAAPWAWQLIKNLRLVKMFDPLTVRNANSIDEIFEALIWRTYSFDGHGGFFPLKQPKEDQTKVEIWYQMNAYVMEM